MEQVSARSSRETSQKHILILKTLSTSQLSGEPRTFELSELVKITAIEDEKEIQRCLYILEGQKLVSPNPPSDFTSTRWFITKQGLEAVRLLERSHSERPYG